MFLVTNILFIIFLLIVAIHDFRTMEIPNAYAIIALLFGVFACFLFPDVSVIQRLIGAICISGFLFLVSMIIPGAFGGGDIKLMVGCGLFLGWQLTVLSFMIAVFVGGLVSVILLILKKRDKKDHIPFGPSLCIGMIASILIGNRLIEWYVGTYWGFL